ncbi:ribonuclease J, partial [Bacillus solimangrovi]|uniref:ribonuclease J n=1 Tax=Bacillus solimangrovi TaxID=1305675 RepID=UPI000AC5706F
KALSKIVTGADRQISIQENDTVIIAAHAVAGTEKSVSDTIDKLFRAGANVIYGQKHVHVTGHGCQEELKLMLSFMKPKFFIPVHGEYRLQKIHADLAIAIGLDKENTFLLKNGECIEFKNDEASLNGTVSAGNVLIDGLGVGDIGNIVLRDRRLLSEDGVLLVVVTLSKKRSLVVSGPELLSRGFVYVRESGELMDGASDLITNLLNECMEAKIQDWSTLKTNIRETLSHYLFERTKRRPMILPIIMEI